MSFVSSSIFLNDRVTCKLTHLCASFLASTAIVQAKAVLGSSSFVFRVDPAAFGTDPAPGTMKRLRVLYSMDGSAPTVAEATDGTDLRLGTMPQFSAAVPLQSPSAAVAAKMPADVAAAIVSAADPGPTGIRILDAFYGINGREVNVVCEFFYIPERSGHL